MRGQREKCGQAERAASQQADSLARDAIHVRGIKT